MKYESGFKAALAIFLGLSASVAPASTKRIAEIQESIAGKCFTLQLKKEDHPDNGKWIEYKFSPKITSGQISLKVTDIGVLPKDPLEGHDPRPEIHPCIRPSSKDHNRAFSGGQDITDNGYLKWSPRVSESSANVFLTEGGSYTSQPGYRGRGLSKKISAILFEAMPIGAKIDLWSVEKRTSGAGIKLFSEARKQTKNLAFDSKEEMYKALENIVSNQALVYAQAHERETRFKAPFWFNVLYKAGWRNLRIHLSESQKKLSIAKFDEWLAQKHTYNPHFYISGEKLPADTE